VLLLALSICAAAGAGACADPSEVQALRARRDELTRDLLRRQQLAQDVAELRRALEQVPMAGMPIDPSEVTRRVSQATVGVAVTVERDGAGLHVALQGASSPPRAAVALEQLSASLPDLQLEQVELEPGRFLAHGQIAPAAPPSAPAPREERRLIPRSEVQALRQEVSRLEQSVRALDQVVGPDLASRGPAALEALRSPARFRQQVRLLPAVAGFAASARVRYQGTFAEVTGTLAPDRKVIDVLPALKADHELLSASGDPGGSFALKLAPRATGR
jgi:hypothetical protein